ncbi:MAG: hypothetical protein IKD76_06000 [Clostridia bacterium]|nr:hypothetical protein [Clostridia bacterium]
MNTFNAEVLKKLNLSKEEVMDVQIGTNSWISNEILRNYRLTSNKEKKVMVNLNDILGYDSNESLYSVMDSLFNPNGDEYHSRSTSLFDLTINNFREKLFPELSNNRNIDPIKIAERRGWKV